MRYERTLIPIPILILIQIGGKNESKSGNEKERGHFVTSSKITRTWSRCFYGSVGHKPHGGPENRPLEQSGYELSQPIPDSERPDVGGGAAGGGLCVSSVSQERRRGSQRPDGGHGNSKRKQRVAVGNRRVGPAGH